MHASPVSAQSLAAACASLITAVQSLNHWLCRSTVCLLQVRFWCLPILATASPSSKPVLVCSFKERSAALCLPLGGYGQVACGCARCVGCSCSSCSTSAGSLPPDMAPQLQDPASVCALTVQMTQRYAEVFLIVHPTCSCSLVLSCPKSWSTHGLEA